MTTEAERRAAACERAATRWAFDGGCWVSTYSRQPSGYAQVGYRRDDGDNVMLLAHRAAWEHLVGPLPVGANLDHVREAGCEHLACVRPTHLEPVTRAENARREGPRHTVCGNGLHSRVAGSWRWAQHGARVYRECVACADAASARRRAR